MVIDQAGIYPTDLFESTVELTADRVWWAVYTKSRQEKVFSQHLAGHDIPHYLPLVPKTYVSHGRQFSAIVPLFSSYVFMLGSEQERVCGLTSNRVSRILEVPDPDCLRAELEGIFRLIASGGAGDRRTAACPGTPRARAARGLGGHGRYGPRPARQDAVDRECHLPAARGFGGS